MKCQFEQLADVRSDARLIHEDETAIGVDHFADARACVVRKLRENIWQQCDDVDRRCRERYCRCHVPQSVDGDVDTIQRQTSLGHGGVRRCRIECDSDGGDGRGSDGRRVIAQLRQHVVRLAFSGAKCSARSGISEGRRERDQRAVAGRSGQSGDTQRLNLTLGLLRQISRMLAQPALCHPRQNADQRDRDDGEDDTDSERQKSRRYRAWQEEHNHRADEQCAGNRPRQRILQCSAFRRCTT